MSAEALSAAFTRQAEACDALGSPFTARVCRLFAARMTPDAPLAERLTGWPGVVDYGGNSVPLRITGALHALVLDGSDPGLAAAYPPDAPGDDDGLWSAVRGALERHTDRIDRFLDSPPQTNEVARSAALIPAAHLLAVRWGLPLRLSELGASAGLNLNMDRFSLDLGGTQYGPGDSAVRLAPEMRGAAGPAPASLEIVERRGVDLSPFDLTDPAQALRLRSYVWADQEARMARMAAAMALPPPPVDEGDAAAWLTARLAGAQPGAGHLVYHTIAWQYFPAATQETCRAALDEAGARATPEAPLAHLSLENDPDRPGASLVLRVWPGGESLLLARADAHLRWLDWQAG